MPIKVDVKKRESPSAKSTGPNQENDMKNIPEAKATSVNDDGVEKKLDLVNGNAFLYSG